MNQKNILLVDDDEELVESVDYILKKAGHKTYSAKDGLEAVDSYEKNRPCLVLMDVKMPNMNGFEAFKKIKSLDKDAKVILISGFMGFDEELKKAREAGLLSFITKPMALQKYQELIEKYY